jgi:hypothetical protein
MKLRAERIEDVPVPELSGLALMSRRGGSGLDLLAVGDRRSRLARADLSGEPLDWSSVDLGDDASRGQFEGVAGAAGSILVLCEHPSVVLVLDEDGRGAGGGNGGDGAPTVELRGGRGTGRDVFDEPASAGEGLVPLREGRLLVAQEKDPPLLVEFGPRDVDAAGVTTGSFLDAGERLGAMDDRLHAVASWKIDDVADVSDLAFAGGTLYCLSDQSRRVVAVELPLDPGSSRARVTDAWDLGVPERRREPDGKPEGLVVAPDGTFIVGLDTVTPSANLCWYRR